MPKHVKARAAQDLQEERQVRKLAKSFHAPADWKVHAQMVLLSWTGKTPNEIAAELGCHPQTVRIHLKRLKLLREDATTAPNTRVVLVIDETGDRKDGHQTAHVARQ